MIELNEPVLGEALGIFNVASWESPAPNGGVKMLNGENIDKSGIFHCHISLLEGYSLINPSTGDFLI